jgi:hypothetical protein
MVETVLAENEYKTYSQFFSTDTKPNEVERVIEEALREYFARHSKIDKAEEPVGATTG